MKRKEIITNFLSAIKLPNGDAVGDVLSINIIETIESFNELSDMLVYTGAFDVDFNNCDQAMVYLTDNDITLTKSLALADIWGYDTTDLNTEILASLLASQEVVDNFRNGNSKVQVCDFFEDLNSFA